MLVNTKALSAALSECGQVIKTRSTLPILTHVRLKAKDGHLVIQATNLDAWIERKVASDGDLEPHCIGLHKFRSLLEAAQTDSVELGFDGKRLSLKSGTSLCNFQTMPANEFPNMPIAGKAVAVSVSDFADGIEAVEWLPNSEAQKDMSNPMKLNTIVELTHKSIDCLTYTGVVAAHFSRALICEERIFIIPNEFAPLLVPVLREPNAELLASDSYIVASSDAGYVAVKIAEGRASNWRDFMAVCSEVIELESEPLQNAAQCIQAIYEINRYPQMDLKLADSTLEISAKANDDYFVSMPAKGNPAEWSLNARFLNNALRHFDSEKVTCRVADNGSLWSSGDLEVMIARLSNPQKK